MKNIIIASTSTLHGTDYLEYLLEDLKCFFNNTKEILFIPYARPGGISHDLYTKKVTQAFNRIDKKVIGIHSIKDKINAIKSSKAIYVGGGNTFVLTYKLYKENLLDPIKFAVNKGTPYLGCSAGSNICGLNIKTTNDMPIVYPPSFKALSLVPFNINPHYIDTLKQSKHMGETRETRIQEFHYFNTQPVVGLREGSWLHVKDKSIVLNGKLSARIFEYNKSPYEIKPGSKLNDLK